MTGKNLTIVILIVVAITVAMVLGVQLANKVLAKTAYDAVHFEHFKG